MGCVTEPVREEKSDSDRGLMQNRRVHVGRMSFVLLVTLILPLMIGVLLDLLFETTPWITIALAIVSLPIAAFFVVRQGLWEMSRVIDDAAPDSSASPPPP